MMQQTLEGHNLANESEIVILAKYEMCYWMKQIRDGSIIIPALKSVKYG